MAGIGSRGRGRSEQRVPASWMAGCYRMFLARIRSAIVRGVDPDQWSLMVETSPLLPSIR